MYARNPLAFITEVNKKADGHFLFAALCMESLRTKSTPLELKRALRRLPDSVEGYYKEVMQRIGERPTEDRKRGHKVLSLVSHELERVVTCTRGHKISCR